MTVSNPNPAANFVPMIQVPAGSFLMGSPQNEKDRYSNEGPQHEVTLQGFSISQTPITQAQWQSVMGSNPSYFKDKPDSDHRPVENVSWHDAMEFCNRMSQRTGRHYTLPSEAQWEYACRAGSATPFHFGEMISKKLANYDGNQTTPVAMYPPNDWGLHGMHGNVWEWCLDDWHDSYEGALLDGSAWTGGDSLGKYCAAAPGSTTPGAVARLTAAASSPSVPSAALGSVSVASNRPKLLRGGSWSYVPGFCRSAFRFLLRPGFAFNDVGFRVVCLPQDPFLDS